MNNTKNLKIVNLRAIAILLVVFGHSIILYSSSWNLYSTNVDIPFLDMLKDIINIIQMPLFFSISGYLFYYTYEKNRGNISQLISVKFKRLLVPFICVALLYFLPIRLIIQYPNYVDRSLIKIILVDILWGRDVGHLWYLPTLFFIFIFVYIIFLILGFLKISNKIKIIICLILFVSLKLGYNFGFQPYVLNCAKYAIWFYMGYVINALKEYIFKTKYTKIQKLVMIIVSISLITVSLITENTYINFITTGVLVLVLYIIIPNRTCKIIEFLDRNSFGIYLFHSPLIYITYSHIPNSSPIIVVFINFVIFGLLSCFIAMLIRKSVFRFIIGE